MNKKVNLIILFYLKKNLEIKNKKLCDLLFIKCWLGIFNMLNTIKFFFF